MGVAMYKRQASVFTDHTPRLANMSEGVWRTGLLLEASYLPQLRNSPMILINPSSEEEERFEVVALCKQGLLKTYEYVNEYLAPNPLGCLLHSADQTTCKFPSVLAAPISFEHIDVNGMLEQLSISLSDLTVHCGLPQTNQPTLLLASQQFMESYGFFTREPVWYRSYTPALLQQVMLAPVGVFPGTPDNIIAQLYRKAEKESIILQQDMKYVFKASILEDPPTSREEVIVFQVLECSPVLQGRLTRDTAITLIPPSQNPQQSNSFQRRKRRSTREERRKKHADSAASATHHTEALAVEAPDRDEGCAIEAVSVPMYKLQSQYIVLPKETAIKHGISHCQNVLIEAEEDTNTRKSTSLSEVTLNLLDSKQSGPEVVKRVHMAIVFHYEDEFELEHYVPPVSLGLDYDTTALTVAYIHPELLFFLFPETLSPSRHYFIRIKKAKQVLPAVKILQVAEVLNSGMRDQEPDPLVQVSLRSFFDKRSVLLHVGEVFKVTASDNGGVRYYKVCSLEPNLDGAGAVEAGSSVSWDCIIQTNRVHSYLPDIVPPSSLTRQPPYFQSISPPGLQYYTDALFSFFLPAFRAINSTQPHRCPSVLITGLPGVGKRTIARAVARRCRMHVMEYNCHEFASDVVPFAEKKFSTDLGHATSVRPVVIILSNVHMIGRKNITQEESRISTLFEDYMSEVNKFNRSKDSPILVVGVTSNPEEIPGRVQSCFLHQLEVSSPDKPQRLSMLSSLSKQYNIGLEVDLPMLAQNTAGFVLGDIVNLLIQAFDLAVQDTYHFGRAEICSAEDISISGVLLKQRYLEEALSIIHFLHSDSIGAPKIPDVKWDDVGGLAEAKKEILDTIQLPLQYPDLFGLGLRRSGLLLYGAPGTGKTLLAKAVATECSLNFLSVKGPELITMYVGQSEENIREVFGRARRCAPCVIFFDELDSIAPNRGNSGDSGGVMDRVVSQFLAELDGLHKSKDVFIIGATNRPDLIDPALLRPGRLDRLVYLGVNEDEAAKENILLAITRKFNLSADVNLSVVARSCPANLTGADLYALCSDAMLTALQRQIDTLERENCLDEEWEGQLEVEQKDFMSALQSLRPSISQEELDKYKSIKADIT